MSGASTEAVHPKFRIWLRADGIVQLVWTPGTHMGLEGALEVSDAIAELGGGRPALLLVVPGDGSTQDRSARLEFARRGDLVAAAAVVVGNPLSRIMGNFFVNVSKPTAPTQLFDDEASAVAWLQEFTP